MPLEQPKRSDKVSCICGFVLGVVAVLGITAASSGSFALTRPSTSLPTAVPVVKPQAMNNVVMNSAVPVQAAAGAIATSFAAPAVAAPMQIASVAEANIVNTAIIMVGAVLLGLVIGFAMLFTEDLLSKK
eukprot:EG_transcript_11307